ncbi:MAG: PAS domain S-box protein [Chloroflexi bacterium]|nr:PAS domain S-box protein [Chloroflexota bacterium]
MSSQSAFLGFYIIILLLGSWSILTFGLQDSLLLFLIIPCIMMAFFFKRWLCLIMIVCLALASVWVTRQVSSDFNASLTTIIVLTICTVLLTEFIHALTIGRQRAEETLRGNEARYRALFEASADAIFLESLEGKVLDCNQQASELFGVPKGELIGLTVADLVPEEIAATLPSVIEAELTSGGVWMEALGQRSDGTIFPTEVRTKVIDLDGESRVVAYVRDITSSKEAEEALQESKEMYQMLVENINDIIYAVDSEGILTYISPQVARYGINPADVISQNALEVLRESLPTEEQGNVIEAWEAWQGEERASYVIQIRNDQGQLRWFEDTPRPRHDAEGNVIGLTGTLRDITDRKEAEAALAGRNRELAVLNDIGQTLSASRDLDEVLAVVLEEVRRLLGIVASSVWLIEPETGELVCRMASGPKRDMVRGWRLAPGEGVAGWVAQHNHYLIVGDTREDQRHFKAVDDQTGLYTRSILSVPLRLEDRVIGVLQTLDTTVNRFTEEDLKVIEPLAAWASIAIENAQVHGELERRVRERTVELREQYARLQAILRSTTDGIVVTDAAGNIIQANPVVRSWLSQTLAPKEVEQLREMIREVVRHSLNPEVESGVTLLELTGLDLELNGAPIAAPDSAATGTSPLDAARAVVAIHDVSHLKALERMKSDFIENLSHELRTPVSAIKAYADLMRRGRPERREEYLDYIVQQANWQHELIERILQISRIDAGREEMRPEPTSLNLAISYAEERFHSQAEKQQLTLVIHPAPEDVTALIDPSQLEVILDNLLSNALRYTLEGGRVTLSTGLREADGRTWATMTVADTGIGIPEDELPHIFERFFRGETPKEMQISGTGLGLSIVQQLVELHGGQITVESQEGEGTTFTVGLPLVKAEAV